MLNKREKGNIGEEIAVKFIQKNGFIVVDRNYYKKWGELDIVATKNGQLHFFEVKSVVMNSKEKSFMEYKPEDNVTKFKTRQLRRIIETYLGDKKNKLERGLDTPFTFHILSVFMNSITRKARVKWMKNVIL